MTDISELRALELVGLEMANAAGEIALPAFLARVTLEFKGEKQDDPVTQVDRRIEAYLRSEISRRFPTHGLLGEENSEDIAAGAEWVWVLDPLDGTTNFANGIPLFGISIGLLHRGRPLVGCIWVPCGPDLHPGVFHAYRGGGAWYQQSAIHLSAPPDERGRLMAVPGGHLRAFHLGLPDRAVLPVKRALPDLRTLGSCTAELVLVASGALRTTVFLGPSIWDVAAGSVIVQEAGGLVQIWKDRGWESLQQFHPQLPDKGNGLATLRNWRKAMLVGEPEAVGNLAKRLRWHPRPPKRLRRLLGLLAGFGAIAMQPMGATKRRKLPD